MECCSTHDRAPVAVPDCPNCGRRGRRVKPVTLPALLREGVVTIDATYRFCKTVDCEVVWFGEETGHSIASTSSRVRIGQKETAADRPLCYCFDYSAADIAREVAETGTSTIPEAIAEQCRLGADRCAETNPHGSCCLGTVHSVLKRHIAAQSRRPPR